MARAADDLRREDEQGTIGVRVTLFADLRRFLPPGVDGPHRRSVPAGSTVAELLAAIGVPDDADITIGVDGELADRATPLREGADVMLLSPMEGGADPPNTADTMRARAEIQGPKAPIHAARQPAGTHIRRPRAPISAVPEPDGPDIQGPRAPIRTRQPAGPGVQGPRAPIRTRQPAGPDIQGPRAPIRTRQPAGPDIRGPKAPIRAARQPVGGRRGERRSLPPTSKERT